MWRKDTKREDPRFGASDRLSCGLKCSHKLVNDITCTIQHTHQPPPPHKPRKQPKSQSERSLRVMRHWDAQFETSDTAHRTYDSHCSATQPSPCSHSK